MTPRSMKARSFAVAPGLAFFFGLGFPKSFSLLYLVLLFGSWQAVRRGATPPSPLLRWASIALLLFGCSYAGIQVWHGVWAPWPSHVPEIMAVVVLPAAGLCAGWLFATERPADQSHWLQGYVLGCLVYALLSVGLSHQPWWNLGQTFPHVLRVPWGDPHWLSTRAVEQRGFLALVQLALVGPLLWQSPRRCSWIFGCLCLGVLGLYVSYATQSRIGLATLYLSLFPLLWHWPPRRWRSLAVGCYGLVPLLALLFGHVCDERFSLVAQFVAHMARAPMGGRLLAFPYTSCLAHEQLFFGSQAGSTAFTPHNVVLDVFNDAGLIPFSLLLLAMLPLLKAWLQGFLHALEVQGCLPGLVLRWGVFAVLLVQWLAQPFLYTDQLMFSLAFVFIGISLREFGGRSLRGSP
jgi:hypothetical protein